MPFQQVAKMALIRRPLGFQNSDALWRRMHHCKVFQQPQAQHACLCRPAGH